MKRVILGAAAAGAMALALAAPAQADRDTEFAETLHTYGIFGQRDYNAWIGKITCKRLDQRVDNNAQDSAEFIKKNLARGTDTGQVYQFLGAALNTYCPEKLSILQTVADRPTYVPPGERLPAERP